MRTSSGGGQAFDSKEKEGEAWASQGRLGGRRLREPLPDVLNLQREEGGECLVQWELRAGLGLRERLEIWEE